MAGEKGDDGDRKSTREKMGEGIRQGIGVLSAFKDALEETIQEARERGDLSTDRAKEAMKGALGKAQAAASGARERLDLGNQGRFEALQAEVGSIEDRVAALEESVFGEVRGNPGAADPKGEEGKPES